MAERLSAAIGWRLADVLRGERAEPLRQDGMATFVRRDDDGTAWIRIPGNDFDTPVEGGMYADAQEGDAVPYSIAGGQVAVTGNVTSPSVGQRVVDATIAPVRAAVSRATESIVMVRSIADAAKRVADAIDQHFWTDTSGIHVTNATQEEWAASNAGPNLLLNSVGQLFRDGLNNLVAITTEQGAKAISFFDGLGNEAENIMTFFGADGARIGYEPDHKTSATYFDNSGFRIKTRQYVSPFQVVPVAGIVATDGSVNDSTSLYLTDNWSYEMPFVPYDGTDICIYSKASTGGRKTLLHTFTAGTAGSVELDAGTFSYDGEKTIQHEKNPLFISTAVAAFSYRRYVEANMPWLHIGRIDFEAGRAGNTLSVGDSLLAVSDNQTVIGKNNVPDYDGEYPLIIGNGETYNERSNAFAVDWDGNVTSDGGLLKLDNAQGETRTYLQAVEESALNRTRLGTHRSVNGTDVYNNLNLIIDDSGNRSVAVSEVAPWLSMLGLSVSSTTATVGAAAASIGTNSVRRSGKVVTVTLASIQLASAISNNSYSGTIATIPSGYRPATSVYGSCFGSGANFGGSYARITTAGVVAIRNQSGSSLAASTSVLPALSITYIID